MLPRMPGNLARSMIASVNDLRKGRDGVGEIAPVERHRHAGDFPVAGRRILAVGNFVGIAPLAFERSGGERILSRATLLAARPRPREARFGRWAVSALGNVHKGIGAFVAIFFGVRRAANAEAVEDEKENAAHLAMRSMSKGVGRLGFPKTIGGADDFLGALEAGFIARMDDGEGL